VVGFRCYTNFINDCYKLHPLLLLPLEASPALHPSLTFLKLVLGGRFTGMPCSSLNLLKFSIFPRRAP